ncbi:MAG: phosphoribosyltransferase family protein [candidate division WOR-3 bacterium]
MRLSQVPLHELEITGRVVRAATPYILEYSEVAEMVADFFEIYKQLINPEATLLGQREREENAETYALFSGTGEVGRFYVVYDINETRLAIELPQEQASKVYRLLREQRIVTPDLGSIRRMMSGNLAETLAAIFWQIGAIKVSLGDLRPLFKVDENKNYSPIYIDVKGLSNYPAVLDFVLSASSLLVRNLEFDVVCGIEAGSIALAALLAQKLAKPMFFARRELRYPEASFFEGVKSHQLFRKKVLLVDDTLVHGWTKSRVIEKLRAAGAQVGFCFVIFDRQEGGEEELARLGVKLLSLTNRDAALSDKIPREISFLTDGEYLEVRDYFNNPAEWHRRRGLNFFPVVKT